MKADNIFPTSSLLILAFTAFYLWSISDQPRMADGALTGNEMIFAEALLTITATFSVFASIFVALRRSIRAKSRFWFFACIFVWPLAYVYTLIVNRHDQ